MIKGLFLLQDTVVMWSNSSCIRSWGLKFDPRRSQLFFPQEKIFIQFSCQLPWCQERWNNGLQRGNGRECSKKTQLEASPLNVIKAADQGEMERKIDLIYMMCICSSWLIIILYNYKDCKWFNKGHQKQPKLKKKKKKKD